MSLKFTNEYITYLSHELMISEVKKLNKNYFDNSFKSNLNFPR